MTDAVTAGGFDPDELARRLALLRPEELSELLGVVNTAWANLSGEGSLSTAPMPAVHQVTATVTTRWRVEATPRPQGEASLTVPEGEAVGAIARAGSAVGTAPAISSPAVAAAWEYLKTLAPKDNPQALETLRTLVSLIVVLWVMTQQGHTVGDVMVTVQETVNSMLEHVQQASEATPHPDAE